MSKELSVVLVVLLIFLVLLVSLVLLVLLIVLVVVLVVVLIIAHFKFSFSFYRCKTEDCISMESTVFMYSLPQFWKAIHDVIFWKKKGT